MARLPTRIGSLAASLVLALTTAAVGTGTAVADEPTVTTPDNIQVDIGASSVTVRWDPSTSSTGDISIYFVKLDSRWLSTDETTMTLHLQPSRTYTVSIKAQDEAYNKSDWSEPIEFTTPDESPVTTPANVRVSDSPGSLTIAWDASDSDAGILDYLVTLRGGSAGTVGQRTTSTSVTFDLPAGGDFEVTVKARDTAYRWSDASDQVAATVAPADDWEPPSAPTDFRAVPDGREVIFQWDAADGGAPPITYEISLDGQEIEQTQDTQLRSPYFAECEPWQTPMTFVVTATSHGFTSPPSNSIELCFS